ncbi:MAG TPA: endonuclease domain-containing protein [Patescibacteria group bacterium]|nr:endonuclease domain-containing protein [Patescibacteria group bacterium]
MKRYFLFNNPNQKIKRRIQIKQSTSAEILLWERLRSKQLGIRFSRQYSIGPYFLDFYCPSKRLAIEVDGGAHGSTDAKLYDQNRTKYLQGFNIKVLRFTNQDIFKSLDNVTNNIENISHSLP